MSLMAPDLSRLFPSNFKSFAENTKNSPFLHPTAMSSPSRLKATERAALTVSLPTNDYKGQIIASKSDILASKGDILASKGHIIALKGHIKAFKKHDIASKSHIKLSKGHIILSKDHIKRHIALKYQIKSPK